MRILCDVLTAALCHAQVKENITKLAKKGSTPSQIGVILRDSHGIAQVTNLCLLSLEFSAASCAAVRLHVSKLPALCDISARLCT